MANPLTGDFDAVIQVSVPTANRLLASMHQNDANEAGSPHTLPHGVKVSIGDPTLGGSLAGISGIAQIQIGAPTVALIPNAPRSANISCWIRARYHPDPKTVSVPEFIHGRIAARFDLTHIKLQILFGASFFYVAASSDDAQIMFTESELNFADNQKVTGLIRGFLRTRCTAVFGLPPEVPSDAFDFRALTDSQGRQAIALAITLNGAAAGSGNLGQVFLDGSDFAIAVSRDAILALMQPRIDQFNQAPKPTFDVPALGMKATYKLSMTAAVAWNGGLTLKISGTAKTSHKKFGIKWFPDVTFSVNQSLTFTLDASAQSVSITPSGEPNVNLELSSGVGKYYAPAKDKAKTELTNRFLVEREKALAGANKEINEKLAQQHKQGRKLLRMMDDGAEIAVASIQSPADGLLLGGKIIVSPRKSPRVEFSPLGDGSGYTAFHSWVPGGWIRQFHWTWWRFEDLKDYAGGAPPGVILLPYHLKDSVDRYILREEGLPGLEPPGAPTAATPYPTGPPSGAVISVEQLNSLIAKDPTIWIPPEGQLCLTIYWERISPDTGKMIGDASQAVLNPDPKAYCALRAWWPERFTKPIEFTRWPCPEVNVIVTQPGDSELVAGSEVLLQVIGREAQLDAPVMLVLAVNIGSRGPSPALAARARGLRQRFPRVAVALADRAAHWLRGLDLPAEESVPALRLVDPAGRLAWRHDGAADGAMIAAALREHLVARPPPRGGLPPGPLRPGKQPPDFSFEIARGQRIALRHLRGRRVAVLFVSEGKDALEAVLRRLSTPTGDTDTPPMAVIVIQDGQGGETAAAPRGWGYDWIAVPDPERAIARAYGISVRPTAVLIDWDGRVSTVQAMSTAIPSSRQRAGELIE